jgi:hypothetical protein
MTECEYTDAEKDALIRLLQDAEQRAERAEAALEQIANPFTDTDPVAIAREVLILGEPND